MLVGFTTEPSAPVRSVGGFGTVGAELVSATVRFDDCVEAPKPSPTVSRK